MEDRPAITILATSICEHGIAIGRLHEDRGQADSLFRRGVKDAVDLHDIIVKQALDLDHRAGWIWRFAPQLCLRLVHHGCEAVQVTDVNSEPHAIL